MSANFMDNSAVMAGVDMHLYFALAPPPILNFPVPTYPYGCGAPFFWPPAKFWLRTGKVKADNWQMIQEDFGMYVVPHYPLPVAPPGPLEVLQGLKVAALGSSEVSLTKSTVHGQGKPLAVCMGACVGLNLNCWEFGSHPSGVVLCISSVKTTPSALDWGLALLKWLTLGLLAPLLGKLGGKWLMRFLKKVPEAVLNFLLKQVVTRIMQQVRKLIRWLTGV